MLKRELFKRLHTQSFNEGDKKLMEHIRPPNAEQAFKSVLYNAAAVAFVLICFGLTALLIIVLQIFVRSILWALLTGAFLFSFKTSLTKIVRKRLKKVAENEGLLSLEIAILPIKLTSFTLDKLQAIIVNRYRQFLTFTITVLLIKFLSQFYEDINNYLIKFFNKFYSHAGRFVIFCDCSSDLLATLFCIYLIAIIFQWNEKTKLVLRILAIPMWASFLLISSKLMGSFRLPFLGIFFFLTFLGVCVLIREIFAKNSKVITEKFFGESVSNENSSADSLKSDENETILAENSCASDDTELTQQHSESTPIKQDSPAKKTLKGISNLCHLLKEEKIPEDPTLQEPQQQRTKNKSLSDKYFLILFWLFIGTKLWPYICIIPILIALWALLKKIFKSFSEAIEKSTAIKELKIYLKKWYLDRESVLAPKPFRELFNLSMKGDRKVNEWLQSSLDSITSLSIMLALLAFLVIAVVLIGFQVQSEFLELIRIYTNILNKNIYAQPYLEKWLPKKTKMNKLIQSAIKSLYIYGREWLSERLKTLISPSADQNVIENQILAQWEHFYNFLSQFANSLALNATVNESTSMTSGLTTNQPAKPYLRTFSTSDRKNIWKLDNYDYTYLISLIKDNIGFFVSLFDSLFTILKSNINLMFTIAQALISLLFQGSFALLNFVISFIVYITALFYLLSSSGEVYKPLQWLRQIKITENEQDQEQSQYQKKGKSKSLTDAIEESIRSVFLASLKMSSFYGVYTYIIHSMFEVNIIFIPSFLAAIFAFLPILGTYWAALPGILELWLIENQPFYAICFLVLHILPTYMVDMAIYSDIKGSHPYLTGLAIAGGLYCLGLEGALIGPIVLCLLIVLVKMNLFLY